MNCHDKKIDRVGDNHLGSVHYPLRDDAFDMPDDQKVEKIAVHVREILNLLGLDLTDDSIQGTPCRVAKMYVREVFRGLNPDNMPKLSAFENKYHYNEMLVEKNIRVFSTCEHHLLPIVGFAHVAYISNGKVIGLSKLNRLVDYYARRPQVQERMTEQIASALQEALDTENVAVLVDAKHLCVNSRGIKDPDSSTVTAFYGGKFRDPDVRKEFLNYIGLKTDYLY